MVKRKFILTGILVFCFLSFTACKKTNSMLANQKTKEIITLGVLYHNGELVRQVNLFNEKSEEYELEIINYADLGMEQIQYEIVSGKGPDIINFGGSYTEGDVVNGVTVDLYEMIEDDEDFQIENYYENIIKSMEVNGKLCTISPDYIIISFAGRKSLIKEESWTMEEMYDYFSRLPGGSILFPGDTRDAVFGYLCMGSMNNFIDWQTGECYFTSDDFINMLVFCNGFRSTYGIESEKPILEIFQDGEALLYPVSMNNVWEIRADKIILGAEEITYVGYPVMEADKKNAVSGNVIQTGEIRLGINKNSDKKEAAWKFISSFFTLDYQKNNVRALPLHKQAMEDKIRLALEGVTEENAAYHILFDGSEPIPVTQITQEDAKQLRTIITGTTRSSNVDYDLYNIIQEEAAAYFAGEKTQTEAAEIIQGRVKIYVSEKY